MLYCSEITVDGFSLINNKYKFFINNLFDIDNDVVGTDLRDSGQSYDHTHMKPKTPLLMGSVTSESITDFLTLRSVLLRQGLKKFVVNLAGIGEVYFMAEIVNWSHDDLDSYVSCQLSMPDPHLYMLSPSSVQLGSISGNSLTFPFVFPIVFGAINGGQGIVTNVGNCTSFPLITITGTCSSLTITNTTTNESIYIDVELLEDDVLVIDNRPTSRGVFLNGVPHMELKTGLWISCAVGDNNFTFQRSSVQDKRHCTVELQSSFI
ncbi:phage distal tail protein [Clostridium pasteurianum]|uniref:Phage tail protein n=1 Tax=Clostridium pasteurianum BC1 TaxID=86416 RepID=R4K3C0_CLOPA|nr:phage tail domain-containing protein [Clostridium pasteurianum]AGK97622.1 Phage tail protein [Clostridium pasteurianum BC1]